jgi:hypothetical protein
VNFIGKEGVRIMRVQKNIILMFLNIMFVLVLVITPTDTLAVCDNQPDGPDCPCFDDTGVWNPGGAYIQDVAIQTVGTRESCACPGTAGCDWKIGPDDPFTNAGKPYYQMVLGCNSEAVALFASWALSHLGPIYRARREWCSEAIAYWHLEAAIPYPRGYRCGWHCDWQVTCVAKLKTWYMTEDDSGGLGRWIEPDEVDYNDFELGVTAPVPGAYVAIRTYDDVNDTWVSGGQAHSLMINKMWVHKDDRGTVFRVEVTLLEGNYANSVRDTRHWDDILSLTPQGSDWIGSKKIYGFGIDLNSERQPIYDPSRLHVVNYQFVASEPPTWPVMATDPVWEQYYDPYIQFGNSIMIHIFLDLKHTRG